MTRTSSYARRALLAALILLVPFFARHVVFAQSPVVVSGAVKDASGGVVSGATVEAVVADRAVATTTSGEGGQYRLEAPSGVPFQLRVHLDGFADYAADMRGASAPVAKDVVLQVGGVSDTLVVTASRGVESRTSVTSSVSVMTTPQIQALGATQLTDVVRFVPGVAVEGTGREGAPTSMFSRGGESDYNLVLIDGVRVNTQGGLFDFSRISTGEIERVEVVRGAQSSLWGSDAMGSVVQIFTKRAGASDAPRVSGSVEAGSFGTRRGNGHLTGGAMGLFDYQAGITYRRTDGAFADILPEDDWFEQTAFDGGFGIRAGTRANVRTGVRYSHDQARNPSFITYGARNQGGIYDTKNFSWHTDVSHTAGSRYTGLATVNYFMYDQISADTFADPPFSTFAILEGTPNALYPNGVRLVRLIDQTEYNTLYAAGAMPGPGQFLASTTNSSFTFNTARRPTRFRRPGIRYQGDYTWADGQRLSAGYDWERESFLLDEVSPNPIIQGFGLDNNAFFIQQQSTFADRIFITYGVRVDSKESYDTFVSPKLSVGGYAVPLRSGALSSVKVFGNIGKGIKSPNFSERFGSAFGDANPDLKVEQARTADIGVETTFASQRLRTVITYFNNDYKDQIAFRPGLPGDGIPENINIDGSDAQGLELELALQRALHGFTAGANYSYVDTRVVTNRSTSQQFQPGQPLLRRPRHSGSFYAAYSKGTATVNFDVRIVGDRHDNSFLFLFTEVNAQYPAPFVTDITVNPGYTVAGLGLDYRVDRALTVFIRGNNITDTEYDSALGYPGLPRSVMVGARFNVGRR